VALALHNAAKIKKTEIEKDLAYEHHSAGGGRCEKNL